MGLDMYLTKRTYVGNKYRKPKQMVKVVIPKDQDGVVFPTRGIKTNRINSITESVGYWRKANQVHKWFVDNVQEGVDDCREYAVDTEQLKELKETCEKVIASLKDSPTKKVSIETGWNKDGKTYEEIDVFTNTAIAEELLPTAQGFFFGGEEYDKWYLKDLEDTVAICEQAIKEGGDFYYDSSW